MNKELIKKYFEEFKHWINGGKVLAYYKKDNYPIWLTDDECITYEDVDNFSHILQNSLDPDDVLIAIDDYYSEFRIAMAEGKTIQYYVDSFVGWQDVKSLNQLCMHPNSFRIKPEEPKFKVGDWVRHIELVSDYGGHILKIEEIDERNKPLGFISLLGQGKTLHSNFAELWQPTEGEWCWFLNNNREPILKQFLQMCPIVPTNYVSKQGTISGSVEPFIGRLPTFLKDI